MLRSCRYWHAIVLFSMHALAQQTPNVAEAAGKVAKSLVLITTRDQSGKDIGLGSGFIVTQDGMIATNLHVIDGAYSASVRLPNGDVYDAVFVVDTDKRKDLALIRIKAIQLPVAGLGDSDRVQTGQHVIAVGNPEGFTGSISDGIVSAIRQFSGYKAIQITSPISPGSSGGALLNDAGEVIGVTQSQFEGQNLNIAIPINYLKPLLQFAPNQQLTGLDTFNSGHYRKAQDESPADHPQGTTLSKTTLDGEWSATVADSKGSATIRFNLVQNSEGDVMGTYTSSLGGGGNIKGKIQDDKFMFELTQSLQNCPGIFKGTAQVAGSAISGTYLGSDCLGDHGRGTLTMSRPGETQINPQIGVQVVPDAMRNDPAAFLEKALRVWTPQNARLVLGEPVRRRDAYDVSKNVTGNIYAYPDPTKLNREFELSFDKHTGTLSLLIIYPWNMTWDQCKHLWGEDVKTTKNPDGSKFHIYRNRRVNVLVGKDGKVINFGIY